jgi:hypothetical protein
VPVELDLNLGSPPGQQVEVAAYYIASEALVITSRPRRSPTPPSTRRHRSSTWGCKATTAPSPCRSATTAWGRRSQPRHGHHRPQRPGRGPWRNNLGPQPARPRNDPARPAPRWPQRRGPRGRQLARRHRYSRRRLPSRSGTRAYRWLPRREGTHAASEAHPPSHSPREGFRQVGRSRAATPAGPGCRVLRSLNRKSPLAQTPVTPLHCSYSTPLTDPRSPMSSPDTATDDPIRTA